MDIVAASNFFVGSILTMLGLIALVSGVVIINNIIAKFWKPLGWKVFPAWMGEPPAKFIEQEPRLDERLIDERLDDVNAKQSQR